MEKEYVVIVHKGVDLTEFDTELAAATGDSPIPNRAVQVADPRKGSKRMTHWMLTDEEAVTLQSDQRVMSVEIPPHLRDDIEIALDAKSSKGGRFKRGGATSANSINWGLRRSNARTNIYFGGEDVNENLEDDYVYALDGGGVDIVFQDTGVEANHPEWFDKDGNSRLQQIDWYAESGISGSQHSAHYTDTNGHGTHVAAIAAGKTYGWAKGAHIYSQKISDFGGSGGVPLTTAFDMIRLWHSSKTNGRPTVVNMSWGTRHTTSSVPSGGFYRGNSWSASGKSDSFMYSTYGVVSPYGNGNREIPVQNTSYDVEVEEMIDAGIHVCISAGNNYYKSDVPSGQDYYNYVTVNGSNYYYHRPSSPYNSKAYFVGNISSAPRISGSSTESAYETSTRGPAINMWAPGTDIMSAASNTVASGNTTFSHPDDASFKVMSKTGTSQSAPQVAGVLALHLQSQPYLSPEKLQRKVIADAIEDIIETTSVDKYVTTLGSLIGGPNRFLRSRYGVDSPFSIVANESGSSSGTGTGTESGSGGVVTPSPEVDENYGSQLGLTFKTQSGDEFILQ